MNITSNLFIVVTSLFNIPGIRMSRRKSLIISKRVLLFGLLIILCFSQNWLLSKSSIFGLLDEAISLFFILYYLTNLKYSKRSERKLFNTCLIFIIYGIICNIAFGIQKSYIGIVEDIFSFFKFLFVYLGLSCYLRKHNISMHKLLDFLEPVLKVYLLIVLFFAILNLITDVGVSNEYRYGIRDFAFFYGTPGHLINQMTYSLLILSARKNIKRNYVWIIISLIIMVLTLKTRAFLLTLIYISLMYLMVFRKKRKIGIQVLLILVIVGLTGYSQFEYYFVTGLTSTGNITPRRRFVLSAVQLVRQYFPFGTGFATYGSSAAAEYYSPIYYQLGWNSFYGMTASSQEYLNDNYLPMIFVQFGVIVGVLFVIFIANYCRLIWKESNEEMNTTDRRTWLIKRAMALFYILDITLSSIQSSYLSHYSVVTLTLIYLIFYSQRKIENEY